MKKNITTRINMKIASFIKGLIAILCITAITLVGAAIATPYLLESKQIQARATKLVLQLTNGQLRINGPISLDYHFGATLTAEQIEFNKIEQENLLQTVTADKMIAEISWFSLLRGSLSFNRLALTSPKIEVKTHNSRLNLKHAQYYSRHPLYRFIRKSQLKQLSLKDGSLSLTFNETKSEFQNIDAVINVGRKGNSLSGSLVFDHRNESHNLSFSALRREQAAPGRHYALNYELANTMLNASYHGELTLGNNIHLNGRQQIDIPDVKRLTRWSGGTFPSIQGFKEFSLDAHTHLQNNQVTLSDAYLTLDGNTAVGAISIDLNGKPSLDGTLAFTSLSLSPYFSRPEHSLADSILNEANLDGSPLKLLNLIDADLRISAGQIRSPYFTAHNSAIMVSLKDRRFQADIVDAEFCDGAAHGRIEINNVTPSPKLLLDGYFREIDTDSCLDNFEPASLMQGKATAQIQLSANGPTWNSMLSSMAGSWTINMKTGGNLRLNLSSLFTENRRVNLKGWENIVRGDTRFSNLGISSSMKNGAASINTVIESDGRPSYSGRGNINFVKNNLDYLITLAATGEKKDKIIKNKSPALRLRGSWSSPEIEMKNH